MQQEIIYFLKDTLPNMELDQFSTLVQIYQIVSNLSEEVMSLYLSSEPNRKLSQHADQKG